MAKVVEDGIDEALYSRQIYVLGIEAMQRMSSARVLILGAGGLGIEIAKNVVLAGVKEVTIHDHCNALEQDLSSQFFICEDDIGKNRAKCSVQQVSQLNQYVDVKCHTDELTSDFVSKFQVVVVTSDYQHENFDDVVQINKICRESKSSFILAETRGVFGRVFCDFGKQFTVLDSDGDPPFQYHIQKIVRGIETDVYLVKEVRHLFDDGDLVQFREVQGMSEINNLPPQEVTVTGPFSVKVGDTSTFGEYTNGGIIMSVKKPVELNFSSLEDSLFEPKFETRCFNERRLHQLHLAFSALHEFKTRMSALPKPWGQADADCFLEIAKSLNEKSSNPLNSVDEALLQKFSYTAVGNLCPVQSIIGGIAAQEVMKAVSGKFTPINQWLYYDAVECLPCSDVKDLETSCQPKGSRYDGQVAVFGEKFQEELAKSKLFLVGAGAIGCEMLKNWAMMGIAVGRDGCVTVTDMDSIEKSNLNRQFLFRPNDVSKLKSETAAAAVKRMNQDMNIVAHENRVGTETENVYSDDFFLGLTAVVNALDNVEARQYVDGRCVYNLKPMFDSGTLGTRCSLQVVIPHLTQCYSDTKDAPEKTYPMCTLKHFPVAIEHTLQWARDEFEGIFKQSVESSMKYFAESDFVEKTRKLDGCKPLEIFQELKSILIDMAPRSFENCVAWARKKFQENYTNQIRQLIHIYPPDHVSKSGAPFWSGPKRCPTPLEFNVENDTHLSYIVAAANLVAQIFNLPSNRDRKWIAQIVAKVDVDEFQPNSSIYIPTTDEEAKEAAGNQHLDSDAVERIENIISSLPDRNAPVALNPQQFEKDDDSNFHIDFIVAASNLRAENYGITPADRHKSKLIVGKIIPAIATTTSVAVGLVCIELYKYIQGVRKTEIFKNAFLNLATVSFVFTRPTPASRKKYGDVEFTIWDRFEIDDVMTVQQFIDYFKEKHKLNVDTISYGPKCVVYAPGLTQNPEERLAMSVSRAVEKASKQPLPAHTKSIKLQIGCYDENDEDLVIEVPFVRYRIQEA